MTHLRLVAGTDVTGISRRRPRAKQASKTPTKPNQTPIPVGAILAAQIEAHETEAVCSPRRRAPQKMMKAEARTVLQNITLAGTDLSGLRSTEKSIEPSEAAALRVDEKAREALRNLKRPGQEKTVGELRDEVSRRCRKHGPSNSTQRALFERFWALVNPVGISLRYGPTGRNGDIEFRCVVSLPDELVAAHPEFKRYVFVLEGLEF